MGLRLITPATGFGTANLDKIKDHLAVNDSSMDTYLTDLIDGARDFIERETDKVLKPETWAQDLDNFPNPYLPAPGIVYGITQPVYYPMLPYWDLTRITLGKAPVNAVTSISYFDANGSLTTLATDQYYVVNRTYLPAFVAPVLAFPATQYRPAAVTITFTVGWSTPPQTVMDLVRYLVSLKFYNRSGEADVGPMIERCLSQIRNL